MAGIRFSQVKKMYGSVTAIEALDLEVRDREFLVLLGPSGCGKSTLLRMLAGLEPLSGGQIHLDDRRIDPLLPRERDIAMVFQSYALYPHLTVGQNIEYPLKIRGMAPAARAAEVLAAARKVELDGLLDRLPRQLSGGQRQRVALARAIVRRPKAFLMDEPLSNLDAKLRVKMRSELKHLHHELAITTVYVTHDQTEALTLADRIAVMESGRIAQLAPPAELYDTPATVFVAGFVGSPAMNLLPGDVEDGTFVGDGLRVPDVAAPPGRDRLLGVRPEDLRVAAPAEAHLTAELFSVELTGDAAYATGRFGSDLLVAAVDRRFEGRIGDPLPLRVDPARTHLFDRATGRRIVQPPRPTLVPASTRG